MEERRIVFRLAEYDKKLVPQVGRAFAKRNELFSRAQAPWLWDIIDKFSKNKKEEKKRSKVPGIILSVVLIILGIVLLVPGIMKPEELKLCLSAGILGVGMGLLGLWSKLKKDPGEKTAEKLMASYVAFEQAPVKGENVLAAMKSVENSLSMVADAFEKQYDSLYRNESYNIEAEVTVLETLLKGEGLVDADSFAKYEDKEKQGTTLTL